MTETENLVLEQLRLIRERLNNIDGELRFQGQRLSALEQHMATLITMIPTYSDEIGRLKERISRIERRLEIAE